MFIGFANSNFCDFIKTVRYLLYFRIFLATTLSDFFDLSLITVCETVHCPLKMVVHRLEPIAFRVF